MGVQAQRNNDTRPLVVKDLNAVTEHNAVIAQNGARATPLVFGTIMAKIASSRKYVPWTSNVAVDGSAVPCAIYIGSDIEASKLVAGDVSNSKMLVASAHVDEGQLVLENSRTLNDVIDSFSGEGDNIDIKTARDYLVDKGIVPVLTTCDSDFENN